MNSKETEQKKGVVLSLDMTNGSSSFTSSIDMAIDAANLEISQLQETIDSIKNLKPECDKTDYILAVCSGAICGIIDIFLVGKPGESPLGDITDKWFSNRTKDFAKLCGWGGGDDKSAIRFLENKFKVPYDQRGAGDKGNIVSGMNPSNHHFKSLAHNPSLLGLFFSILDQFTNSSHFVGVGRSGSGGLTLIHIEQADDTFELRGNNLIAKFFCAFVNWFGHLMSDASGTSGGTTRGKGIPSPLWSWCNDIIVLKSKLGISSSKFDESFYKTAQLLFNHSYDLRFQTAQAIPVLLNELLVRLMYMIRRLVAYLHETNESSRSFKNMWDKCKPYSNPTVKRMLTVAHGTFCLMDVADAAVRAYSASLVGIEFLFRLNLPGIGRFAVCLFGEVKDTVHYHIAKHQAEYAQEQKTIVEDYIDGLKVLYVQYDDKDLIDSISHIESLETAKEAFGNAITLAEKRGVPNALTTKESIDNYFLN